MSKFLFVRDMLLDDRDLIAKEWIELLEIVSQGIDRTDTQPENLDDES